MASVMIDRELQTKLDATARRLHRAPEEIASEAIQTYLEQLDTHKLEAEIEAYATMHARLLREYAGQYVAIHDGAVVDNDPAFEPVCLRIQERFGETVVLIRRVGATLDEEYHFRSPRIVEE